MHYEALSDYLANRLQDALARVIGDYAGPFSFGIIHEKGKAKDVSCFHLSLPRGVNVVDFPTVLDVDGQDVKIVVDTRFKTPTAPPPPRKSPPRRKLT